VGLQERMCSRPLACYLTALGVVTASVLCSTLTASSGADPALAQAGSFGPSAAISDTQILTTFSLESGCGAGISAHADEIRLTCPP
jgi:hypothetical protein